MPIYIRVKVRQDTMTPYLRQLRASLNGQAQRRVTMAMGKAFFDISRANLGVSGVDRPTPWPALSERYKRQLQRNSPGSPLIPTLLRSGSLLNSIRIQSDSTSCKVYSNSPYAASQQYGYKGRNLPARPYFPIVGDELTVFANGKVLAAANSEMLKIVKGI